MENLFPDGSLGVIASVIKDLRLIDMIDARLVPDAQEILTPGEAVAGMMLNGLGFAHRPLSLTPQFFASKPLDLLLREGINAEMFNRFKLGRTLDEAHAYGCDLLFQELALAICAQEGIDRRFNHLDTTSFALTGEYVPDSDAQAICIVLSQSSIFGQNPKIWCQEFNDLQTPKLSKKQLCDRTGRQPWLLSSRAQSVMP